MFCLFHILRCSPAFFLEERQALEEKRRKIRMLQQRKVSISNFPLTHPTLKSVESCVGKSKNKNVAYNVCFFKL